MKNENQKTAENAIKTAHPFETQKNGSEIYIHKIASLGDEVNSNAVYDEACQIPKDYLDKRYTGILKFETLASDYTEGNTGIKNPIYRYSDFIGGQYSCFFKGIYVKDFPDLKVLDNKTFLMKEFNTISFNYPDIESFELKQNYNTEKKSGEITYFSQRNLISESTSSSPLTIHRHPMLIIQKMDSKTPDYSIDKKNINPSGIKYKLWNEHTANNIEYYFNDPYDNLDTTLEFDVSDTETYLISTVNFIYNGISEQSIVDIISNSFKIN